MPKGTKVERCYTKLAGKSKASKEKAARICQATTGLALKTGKPPKKRVNESFNSLYRRILEGNDTTGLKSDWEIGPEDVYHEEEHEDLKDKKKKKKEKNK